jgi:hypothetical protein
MGDDQLHDLAVRLLLLNSLRLPIQLIENHPQSCFVAFMRVLIRFSDDAIMRSEASGLRRSRAKASRLHTGLGRTMPCPTAKQR